MVLAAWNGLAGKRKVLFAVEGGQGEGLRGSWLGWNEGGEFNPEADTRSPKISAIVVVCGRGGGASDVHRPK